MVVTSKAPRKAQVLPPAPQLMTFSAFSVWQVDPTLPHQQHAVPPDHSPAGTCRDQGSPQEDEQVFCAAKTVIQSCHHLTRSWRKWRRWRKTASQEDYNSGYSWGIKVSLWKSPSSAFTGDTSGAEPCGPGLLCQGVNWLPVPALPVCGMDMQDSAAI